MTVNCYQISDGPNLKPCEYNFAVEAIRQRFGLIYLTLKPLNWKRNWMI
jgi:hypothetical protein